MTFQKTRLTYIQYHIYGIILAMLGITFFYDSRHYFFLFFVLFYPALIAMYKLLYKETITIDHSGIFCENNKQEKWGFQWNEIEELKIGTIERNRQICIIPLVEVRGTPPYGEEPYHFEYSQQAKRALAKYKPEHITLTRYR